MDFNLTQIEADPINCWNRMTPLQLERFEDKFYARIEKMAQREIRSQEEKDKRDLRKTNKRLKYTRKVFAMYTRIHTIWVATHDDDIAHYHARSIGNDIHDLPTIWTGLESEASIASKGTKGYSHSNEHFYPRQYAGLQIVKHIIEHKGINFTRLLEFLDKFRQVHHVTPEENRKLMKYQSAYVFSTPEIAYKQAGIVLVKQEQK